MKRFLAFFITLFLSTITFGQLSNYWPPALGAMPKCTTMPPSASNCTKWPVVNNGQWDVGTTWNGGTVPGNNAIVCIPSGWTVIVKGQTYSSGSTCFSNPTNTPKLRIFVCGNIQFDNSGKLFLDCFSFIQVYTGGNVLPPPGNGSSDLIQIGAQIVWGGPGSGGQAPLVGPYILSYPYAGNGVLPVAFDFFKAQQKSPFSITLDWGTLQEVNNTNFIIERSTDQKAFAAIGSVKSAGTSYSRNTYSFIDKNPASGNNYYRLKQVDENGNISYSETVRVVNQVKKNISLFPNPVTASAQLYSKTNFEKGQSIEIIDSKGSRIKSIVTNGSNTMQIDMSSLLPGLYLLRVTDNGNVVEHISFIKQ